MIVNICLIFCGGKLPNSEGLIWRQILLAPLINSQKKKEKVWNQFIQLFQYHTKSNPNHFLFVCISEWNRHLHSCNMFEMKMHSSWHVLIYRYLREKRSCKIDSTVLNAANGFPKSRPWWTRARFGLKVSLLHWHIVIMSHGCRKYVWI